jgi:hypothetical protein
MDFFMSVLIPTLCIGGVGLLCAVTLAVANKYISVPEDPRVLKVIECLPGANCGGCGFAAALGFSLALVIFTGLRERIDRADPPRCFKGMAVSLITAGLLSLAFMGFDGLVK